MSNEVIGNTESLLIDEFEIIELEDRLELNGRCNISGCGDGPVIITDQPSEV